MRAPWPLPTRSSSQARVQPARAGGAELEALVRARLAALPQSTHCISSPRSLLPLEQESGASFNFRSPRDQVSVSAARNIWSVAMRNRHVSPGGMCYASSPEAGTGASGNSGASQGFSRTTCWAHGLGLEWPPGFAGGRWPAWPYLGDGAHGLGAAFPEHQPLVYVQVLGGLDEAEVHAGLVPSAQTVLVHAQNGGRLPDAPTVHCPGSQTSGQAPATAWPQGRGRGECACETGLSCACSGPQGA